MHQGQQVRVEVQGLVAQPEQMDKLVKLVEPGVAALQDHLDKLDLLEILGQAAKQVRVGLRVQAVQLVVLVQQAPQDPPVKLVKPGA